MAEVFKKREKTTETHLPLIARTQSEPHSTLDVLSHAASVRSRDAYSDVATADIHMRALSNRQRYDSEGNPIGKRFAALMERV